MYEGVYRVSGQRLSGGMSVRKEEGNRGGTETRSSGRGR